MGDGENVVVLAPFGDQPVPDVEHTDERAEASAEPAMSVASSPRSCDLPGFVARRVGTVAAQHERGSPRPAVVAHFPAQPRRRCCHPLRRPILRVRRPIPLASLVTVAGQR